MEQPIVLCGLGRVGWRVLEYLRAAGFAVVVVDNRAKADDPRLAGVRLVRGDCRQRPVLEDAGVPDSRGVLIMTNDDLVNICTALLVRHLHPSVRVVMRLFNQNLIPRMGKAVNNVFALSTSTLTAPLFALTALTGQALGSIRLEGLKDGLRQVAEVPITTSSPLRGKTLAEVATRYSILVLGHFAAGGADRFLLEVDLEESLIPGDRLVLCGRPEDIAQMFPGQEENLTNVKWASFLRRNGRVVWRTLAEVDLAVKICTGVLIGVILVSTLILRFSGTHDPDDPDVRVHESLAHAFFRTISLMATGADMQEKEFQADWLKIYASILRISGAALMAAFTAIVTNYLLRARLGGALEVRRIPDSGHVIVCGLGNIGFRVVEELLRCDERVVVIEQDRDSRFVATARRLGVPVLIGDATVAAVLQQSHAAQARAVIAATSDDLLNLEVALMVRDLHPTMRVVLHLSDPNLAQMLRESANVRLALSIPTLAAPAFVAALFGDRVQNVFMVDGRLLATVDLLIPAQDPCLVGNPVRGLAVDYGFLPVAVFDAKGILQAKPMTVRLEAGYRLVAISAMPDLERLLRRDPVKADYAVDLVAFPLPAREWAALQLRSQQHLSAEAAESALAQLPVCLGNNLTRGQAEDLLALCQREKVTAQLRQL